MFKTQGELSIHMESIHPEVGAEANHSSPEVFVHDKIPFQRLDDQFVTNFKA